MAGQITLNEVARRAGVSVATASRVLHGATGRTVGADLAARVQQAAADLSYSANAPAQATARGTTNTIGLVVHDIADPYTAAIAAGVIEAAMAHDLIVTIAATQSHPAEEVRHIRALHGQRARGIILAGSRFTPGADPAGLTGAVAAFQSGGGKVVSIGSALPEVATVPIPHREGSRLLAGTLGTLGYRRFAVLAGPEQFVTSEERLTGLREGFAEFGVELAAENIIGAQFTRDGGYVAMRELLDLGAEVDCVVAVSDVMAVGAMTALREQRYRLPQDMAVAGFDDIAMLRDIDPPLTTVRLPLTEIGRAALGLVTSATAGVEPVRAEVVVRASTPPAGPS